VGTGKAEKWKLPAEAEEGRAKKIIERKTRQSPQKSVDSIAKMASKGRRFASRARNPSHILRSSHRIKRRVFNENT